MKAYPTAILLLATVATSVGAFSPPSNSRASFSLQNSPSSAKPQSQEAPINRNHNAAFAAFATAMAPVVVQAAEVDEGVAIGYGAGIVACAVSLAVGFSIGYGTLV